MRTTVTLDDDVFKAAKAQAEASGKKLGQVLSQLARRGMRASAQSATKSGLPVFKVQPDADIIPSSRAKELLAEDATQDWSKSLRPDQPGFVYRNGKARCESLVFRHADDIDLHA